MTRSRRDGIVNIGENTCSIGRRCFTISDRGDRCFTDSDILYWILGIMIRVRPRPVAKLKHHNEIILKVGIISIVTCCAIQQDHLLCVAELVLILDMS